MSVEGTAVKLYILWDDPRNWRLVGKVRYRICSCRCTWGEEACASGKLHPPSWLFFGFSSFRRDWLTYCSFCDGWSRTNTSQNLRPLLARNPSQRWKENLTLHFGPILRLSPALSQIKEGDEGTFLRFVSSVRSSLSLSLYKATDSDDVN